MPQSHNIMVACAQCNSPLTRAAWQMRKNAMHFCNNACRGAYKSRFAGKASRYYKRIAVSCAQCGASLERTPWRVKNHQRQFCDHGCFSQWKSANTAGKNSPRWHGGYAPYYGPNWLQQQRRARRRDNETCCHCGCRTGKNERKHDVHHIRPFREFGYTVGENENYKQANHLTNLITLCKACHVRAEHGKISFQLNLL